MPIYEFYCSRCNTLFNFFSRTVDTRKTPNCPKCKIEKLDRHMSTFAFTGRAKEDEGLGDLPFDESKMEQAMHMLAGEAGNIDEDDPRQAAQVMRKLKDMTGIDLGDGMEEALARMERGEEPEKIEEEMGDLLEGEDPIKLKGRKGGRGGKRSAPSRDETLYDL